MHKVPFCRPAMGPKAMLAITETITGGWLTTGAKVSQFETEFATAVDAEKAIATSSGSMAMFALLWVLKISKKNPLLIVPSMTFYSTAMAALNLGIPIRFCDVDPNTLNVTPHTIKEVLSEEHTNIVVVTHFAGLPCDMESIGTLLERYDSVVIEDAAHAFPASCGEHKVGSCCYSAATVFSFYATKNLTTGEGGMITIRAGEFERRIRQFGRHGMSATAMQRFNSDSPVDPIYDLPEPGFKMNMTDMAASLGLAQLPIMKSIMEARTKIADQYHEKLSEQFCVPVRLAPKTSHGEHLYVVKLPHRVGRPSFLEKMYKKGVQCSVHYWPTHCLKLFSSIEDKHLLFTDTVKSRIVSLPLYHAMLQDDVDVVIEAANSSLKECLDG